MRLSEPLLLSKNLEATLVQGLGQCPRVLHNLSRVFSAESHHLGKHHSLPRQMVEVVVAHVSGESGLFDSIGILRLRKDQSALRSWKGLVRTSRHGISVLVHRVLELSTCYKAGDVSRVKADLCAVVVEDCGELLDRVWEW